MRLGASRATHEAATRRGFFHGAWSCDAYRVTGWLCGSAHGSPSSNVWRALLVCRPAARADAARAGQADDEAAEAGLATRGAASAVALGAAAVGVAAGAQKAEAYAVASTRQGRACDRFKSVLLADNEACSVYRTRDVTAWTCDPSSMSEFRSHAAGACSRDDELTASPMRSIFIQMVEY